ncbi:PIN domain-containing protein [Rathayibacter sp. CAU 1779]
MKYLLDTNILSEARRGTEKAQLWLEDQDRDDLAISVLTLAELDIGVRRKERSDPRQGVALRLWLDEAVIPAFENRVLSVDERVAIEFARMQVPDPVPMVDALIAASAIVHSLTLVTRNTKDMQRTGVQLLDPWLLGTPDPS